jgi:hypothetical protein
MERVGVRGVRANDSRSGVQPGDKRCRSAEPVKRYP